MGRRRGKKDTLTKEEDDELVKYIHKMQGIGFPISLEQSRLKVVEVVQGRENPLYNDISGNGWVKVLRGGIPKLLLGNSKH